MSRLVKTLRFLKAGAQCLAKVDNRLQLEWYLRHRSRLWKYKDIHRGESCFIIGNGPSLNRMDLAQLKERHTFGLNKIYLMFDRLDLDLSYHVAVNALVIEQGIRQFEALDCPSFLSFGAARTLTSGHDHIHMLATNSYFNAPYSFYTDPLQPINEGYTVTFVALQLAYFMGFQKVFLVGVDHNFQAQGSPNEEQLLVGDDQNHFDPRYFSRMKWQLPDLEASELSYHLARFFYNRDGRQILDATVDGKLQVFPKVSFEEALRMSK